MKIKKKHITTVLATLLLVSPLYFSTENKTEATVNRDLSKRLLKNNSIKYTAINSPLEIPEVVVVGKRIPNLKELDSNPASYLEKREADNYINLVYQNIRPPKEISKELFLKLIQKESSFNIYAHHKKSNARGLTQIREETWKTLEKKVSYKKGVYNPEKNLEVSLKFMKWLKNYNKKFNPKWDSLDLKEKQSYILASYNWGPGNLKKASWNLNKIPSETKDYINYILK